MQYITLKLTDKLKKFVLDARQDIVQNYTTQLEARRKAIDHVDRALSGYVDYNAEDLIRVKRTDAGEAVAPPTIRPQIALPHLSKVTGKILKMVLADNNTYAIQPNNTEQSVRKALNFAVNSYAEIFGHKFAMRTTIEHALKYNISFLELNWEGTAAPEEEGLLISQPYEEIGVRLKNLDPYNVWFDPSVDRTLDRLPTNADFLMYEELTTKYNIQRKVMRKQYTKDVLEGLETMTPKTDYKERVEAHVDQGSTLSSVVRIGAAGQQHILSVVYLRAMGKDIGLDNSQLYTIRAEIINGKTVASVVHLANNDKFPVVAGRASMPDLGSNNTSLGEALTRLQDVGAFEINQRLMLGRSEAKNGKLLVDRRLYDHMEKDLENQWGPIPIDTGTVQDVNGDPIPLNQLVMAIPPTQRDNDSLVNLSQIKSIMNDIAPSNAGSQMAGLNRATQFQSQAVMEESNTINQGFAETLDTQIFKNARIIMLTLLIHSGIKSVTYNETDESVEVPVSSFNTADTFRAAADGLQGTDKFYVAQTLRELFTSVLQSPQQGQTLDIRKVLDQMVSLMGVPLDLSDIIIDNAYDNLTPEQKEMAYQMLVQQMQQQAQQQPEEGM